MFTMLLEDVARVHKGSCTPFSMLVIRSYQMNLLTEKGATLGSILAIRLGAKLLREVESLPPLRYMVFLSRLFST
jgi:hypothetical protein